VRVHEKHASLRSQGFGLAIQPNGVRVLDALNVRPETANQGQRIRLSEQRDAHNRVLSRTPYNADSMRISRNRLLTALAERAAEAGAELVRLLRGRRRASGRRA
jgi:2-polyprenyl-6-methoxyphenol hydroxylase-like FAD-dependent oxidoreductase